MRPLIKTMALAMLAFVVGYGLTMLILHLPVNMPFWLDASIRKILALTGNDDAADPDTMAAIGFCVIFAASFALSGFVVWIGYRRSRRR